MKATTPEEVNDLFIQAMQAGDMEAVLTLYDTNVSFASPNGDVVRGIENLRSQLSSFVAKKTRLKFDVTKVIDSGDIALVHNEWELPDDGVRGHAIEVARRQPDGSWRWLIGDPYTIRSQAA
jgi:ketosteroid isomerase-like protein